MIENSKLDIAQEYFKKAYKLHLEGKIEEAVDYYRMSIDIYPTAEAHTFLGWAYSLQGKFEDAIDECHTAIELDDSYGNPYNDIGAYLIDLGKYDDSVEWFERAINAPRYVFRHLPYYNLGRVYEKKGDWFSAIKFYNDALKINRDYEAAKNAVIRLTTLMN
ncbi:MAG: tetratricopeptide repeat protein [Bacteroidota bacterium]|nr:tetratricopeptide repeat protein [Bacteroidota bacterium]MDP4191787.1 tetratricopeptide repeat protein [Bacteroidota bacterium]MDP4195992.1 tetratricopeptide repeat protein [Bacteroidota bacterium]